MDFTEVDEFKLLCPTSLVGFQHSVNTAEVNGSTDRLLNRRSFNTLSVTLNDAVHSQKTSESYGHHRHVTTTSDIHNRCLKKKIHLTTNERRLSAEGKQYCEWRNCYQKKHYQSNRPSGTPRLSALNNTKQINQLSLSNEALKIRATLRTVQKMMEESPKFEPSFHLEDADLPNKPETTMEEFIIEMASTHLPKQTSDHLLTRVFINHPNQLQKHNSFKNKTRNVHDYHSKIIPFSHSRKHGRIYGVRSSGNFGLLVNDLQRIPFHTATPSHDTIPLQHKKIKRSFYAKNCHPIIFPGISLRTNTDEDNRQLHIDKTYLGHHEPVYPQVEQHNEMIQTTVQIPSRDCLSRSFFVHRNNESFICSSNRKKKPYSLLTAGITQLSVTNEHNDLKKHMCQSNNEMLFHLHTTQDDLINDQQILPHNPIISSYHNTVNQRHDTPYNNTLPSIISSKPYDKETRIPIISKNLIHYPIRSNESITLIIYVLPFIPLIPHQTHFQISYTFHKSVLLTHVRQHILNSWLSLIQSRIKMLHYHLSLFFQTNLTPDMFEFHSIIQQSNDYKTIQKTSLSMTMCINELTYPMIAMCWIHCPFILNKTFQDQLTYPHSFYLYKHVIQQSEQDRLLQLHSFDATIQSLAHYMSLTHIPLYRQHCQYILCPPQLNDAFEGLQPKQLPSSLKSCLHNTTPENFYHFSQLHHTHDSIDHLYCSSSVCPASYLKRLSVSSCTQHRHISYENPSQLNDYTPVLYTAKKTSYRHNGRRYTLPFTKYQHHHHMLDLIRNKTTHTFIDLKHSQSLNDISSNYFNTQQFKKRYVGIDSDQQRQFITNDQQSVPLHNTTSLMNTYLTNDPTLCVPGHTNQLTSSSLHFSQPVRIQHTPSDSQYNSHKLMKDKIHIAHIPSYTKDRTHAIRIFVIMSTQRATELSSLVDLQSGDIVNIHSCLIRLSINRKDMIVLNISDNYRVFGLLARLSKIKHTIPLDFGTWTLASVFFESFFDGYPVPTNVPINTLTALDSCLVLRHKPKLSRLNDRYSNRIQSVRHIDISARPPLDMFLFDEYSTSVAVSYRCFVSVISINQNTISNSCQHFVPCHIIVDGRRIYHYLETHLIRSTGDQFQFHSSELDNHSINPITMPPFMDDIETAYLQSLHQRLTIFHPYRLTSIPSTQDCHVSSVIQTSHETFEHPPRPPCDTLWSDMTSHSLNRRISLSTKQSPIMSKLSHVSSWNIPSHPVTPHIHSTTTTTHHESSVITQQFSYGHCPPIQLPMSYHHKQTTNRSSIPSSHQDTRSSLNWEWNTDQFIPLELPIVDIIRVELEPHNLRQLKISFYLSLASQSSYLNLKQQFATLSNHQSHKTLVSMTHISTESKLMDLESHPDMTPTKQHDLNQTTHLSDYLTITIAYLTETPHICAELCARLQFLMTFRRYNAPK